MPIDRSWEPPTLRERERSYWWAYLIGIVFIVWLVLYIVYLLTSAPPAARTQEVTPTSPASTPVSVESKPVFKSEAPVFDSKCTVVAGVVPGSLVKTDNKVTFTFKNNGKSTIEGSYFEASNAEKKAYRQNSESLLPDAEATYTIDLNDVSNEVGIQVESFVVLPVQNGKACLNQRMIVFK